MDNDFTRCFVVCGRSITEDELRNAFRPYGNVLQVKRVESKGGEDRAPVCGVTGPGRAPAGAWPPQQHF